MSQHQFSLIAQEVFASSAGGTACCEAGGGRLRVQQCAGLTFEGLAEGKVHMS